MNQTKAIDGLAYLFDECVTNAVRAVLGTRKGLYETVLRQDWSNETGSAFGGYTMALANRAVVLHLRDTGDGQQFQHPISIQAQFIGATRFGWKVQFEVETVKTGKNIAYLHLRASRADSETPPQVFFTATYVYGSLTNNRAPVDFEVAQPPVLPPMEDCVEYGSPFNSKYFDYKISLIPKGADPFRGKEKTAAYVGWRDGRPLDLASATLLGDIWSDFRIFHQIHGNPNLARISAKGTVPRGKIGLRTSGSISMSMHFFHVPSPSCRWFVADMEIGLAEGAGDYALYLWEQETGKLVAICRQIQQTWAIRNEDDVKEGIEVKL